MTWELEWGSHVGELERLAAEGKPVPTLDRRDEADITGLEWVFDIFNTLSTCRELGPSGAGPIPWTAVDRYATRLRLSTDEFNLIWRLIQAMDAAYLTYVAEKAEAERGASGRN